MMEKKLSKQILSSIVGIIEQSEGYQVNYSVSTEKDVTHFPKVVSERTTITIILIKKVS